MTTIKINQSKQEVKMLIYTLQNKGSPKHQKIIS